MEYRPFLEPMPAYEGGWFQDYEWSDDPLPFAGILTMAAVGIPLGGWLATAIIVGLGVLFFGWGFWAVMSMIWTILVVVGILCALAAVGLLVYRIAVLPSLRQQNLAQSEQAMAAWSQRRAAHVAAWEQRLGWTE